LDISTDGGSSWTSSTALPASTASISEVACGSATTCFAAGFGTPNGAPLVTALTTNAGSSWTSATGPSGFDYPTNSFAEIGISCTSASICIIVGTGASGPIASVTTNDGGSWTSSPVG
jgi:hypothetical protein